VYFYEGVRGDLNDDIRGSGGRATKNSRLTIARHDPLHYRLDFYISVLSNNRHIKYAVR